MKTKKILFTIVASVLLFGCSLEEEVFSPTADNFIKSEVEMRAMTVGIQSYYNSYNNYKSGYFYMLIMGANDVVSLAPLNKQYATRLIPTGGIRTTNPWQSFYQAIAASNAALESVANTDDALVGPEAKEKFLGELYFFRAFSYFVLVRTYGNVPISTEPTTGDSDFYPESNSVDDVYALIFEDLMKAEDKCILYSEQNPATDGGMPNKGAAQAVLAEAYLTYANYLDLNNRSSESAAYYKLARDYADKVILSGEYHLIPDYADLWDINKEKDAYNEVIWGIQFASDPFRALAGSKGSEFAWIFNSNKRENVTPDTKNNAWGAGRGVGWVRVNQWFYDIYQQGDYVGDYRSEVSFITKWFNTKKNKTAVTYPNLPPQADEIKDGDYPYIDKYKDPGGIDKRNMGNDLFVLRLADMYLIKAEAENELNGPTGIAYEAFNKLRERARNADGNTRTTPVDLAPGLSKEEFRMAIYNERGLEFVGEGKRWYDLIRMRAPDNTMTMMEYEHTVVFPTLDSKKLRADNVRSAFDKRLLLWPIPSSEVDTNPNLGGQNPDW